MKIKEVSERMALSQDTLRYYEKIHLIPPVKRTASGIREYDQQDLRWIEFIKCMRNAGLSIEALCEYVKLYQEGDSTTNQRMQILYQQRAALKDRLEAMHLTLERLNDKISLYESEQEKCL